MYKKRYKEPFVRRAAPYISSLVLFFFVLSLVFSGLYDTKKAVDEEGLRIAEESIRRAAVNCYAIEGSYPQGYEYLKQHYGIRVDESRYIIHYEIFASNIMPIISVSKIERQIPL